MNIHQTAGPVDGLDDSFDTLIKGLPDHLIGAPDDAFLDPTFSKNPFPILAELRDRAGGMVRRGEDGLYAGTDIFNVWGHDLSKPHFVALSHEAVSKVGSDRNAFISDQAYGMQQTAHGATVNCLDGQEHFIMRRLLDCAFFGRQKMQDFAVSLTEPIVTYLVDRLEAKIRAGETGEICRDIALPVTYKSISSIIGVPQAYFAHFVELGEIAQGGPRDLEAAMKAIQDLDSFFADELEKRKTDPQSDMLTVLQTEELKGRKMTEAEIIQHCRFLLPGGIETTWRQTANMIMALMLHPNQYEAVVEDTSLIEQTVEEVLRWGPSGFVVPRHAAVDTEVSGTEIPAGSFVCSIQGIANRDPAVWDKPDQFDIFREKHEHLTFHTGIHFCMGQHLARNTFRAVLKRLVEKLPDMKLACDPSDLEMRGFGVRCPLGVPVTA